MSLGFFYTSSDFETYDGHSLGGYISNGLYEKYNISSSAIMFWNGDYSSIYNTYITDPEFYQKKYSEGVSKGDQAMVSDLVEHCFINDLVPKDWIHVVGKNEDTMDFSNTRILIFRKNHTKPSKLLDHILVKTHWK